MNKQSNIEMQTTLKNFSLSKDILRVCSNAFDCDYDIFIDVDMIRPEIKVCPKCKSKISYNGYNPSYKSITKNHYLHFKKGKIVCSNKKCNFQLNFSAKNINALLKPCRNFLKSILLSLKAKGLSSSQIASHLEEIYSISLSEESIRKEWISTLKDIEVPEYREKPSGILIQDEQFIKIKGKDVKRITIIDALNKNVYHDDLYDNRNEKTILAICEQLKKFQKPKAVVLDGHRASKSAFEKVFDEIKIQYCIFHYLKNVKDAYRDEVGYGKGKSCLSIKDLIGFFSIANIFSDHERELILLRNLQRELLQHIERINNSNYDIKKKIEYSKNFEIEYARKAREQLNRIRKKRRTKKGIKLRLRDEKEAKEKLKECKKFNVFPKKVQKQIKRLEREWENFTHCLRDKRIPPTTNKLEQYYALTLNWIEKNNLQSAAHFYLKQKVNLFRRYKQTFLMQNTFSDFISTFFLLTYGFT